MNAVKLCVLYLVVIVFSFSAFSAKKPLQADGAIRGQVSPAEGGRRACAIIAGADTIKSDIVLGNFRVNGLKAGNYTLLIETYYPYKPVTRTDILVLATEATDVGVINLTQ